MVIQGVKTMFVLKVNPSKPKLVLYQLHTNYTPGLGGDWSKAHLRVVETFL